MAASSLLREAVSQERPPTQALPLAGAALETKSEESVKPRCTERRNGNDHWLPKRYLRRFISSSRNSRFSARYLLHPAHNWHRANQKWSDFMRAEKNGRLIGRQPAILVDPFSPLHHQCVA